MARTQLIAVSELFAEYSAQAARIAESRKPVGAKPRKQAARQVQALVDGGARIAPASVRHHGGCLRGFFERLGFHLGEVLFIQRFARGVQVCNDPVGGARRPASGHRGQQVLADVLGQDNPPIRTPAPAAPPFPVAEE